MSLEVLRKIVAANPDLPDGALAFDGGERRVGADGRPGPNLGRVKVKLIVDACDEIPVEKLDKKAKEIRAGAATLMREQSTPEKAAECLAIVPIGYLRHLVALAGG